MQREPNGTRYYSCFISFASQAVEFSERLYHDLQSHGVRCWFAPKDMPIGAKLRTTLDNMIGRLDKVVVILSRESIASQWVEQEIESALLKERTQKEEVLIPLMIDGHVMSLEGGWAQYIRNTRNIGDFTGWTDLEKYNAALLNLLKSLAISRDANATPNPGMEPTR
jgi:hypothetical protein